MAPNPYFFIVIFVGVALVFPLLPLALAWLWRKAFQPPKPGAEKNAIYECGVEAIGDAQIQFRSQYYLYAISILIFYLAVEIRTGLLRDRDDRNSRVALRHRALRRRSLSPVAASGRSDDRCRHSDQEDGAANRSALQPDARSEVRHLDGRVRDFRR